MLAYLNALERRAGCTAEGPWFRKLDDRISASRIRGEPCYLEFPHPESVDGRFAESFCDVRNGAATINLQRERFLNDPLAATILLAHEFGHACSWGDGYGTELVAELNTRARDGERLSKDDALTVLDEECRAWLYAERELSKMEFPHMQQFRQTKATSLASYCKGFLLDENAWEQRERACKTTHQHTLTGERI
jgi:hypothetical protein